MIDEEWLDQSLRYEFPDGGRFVGLLGAGGSNIVIACIGVDGRPFAMRVSKEPFLLPCYLREVPNWIAPSPQYDVDRLNDKLKGALGDPMLLLLLYKEFIDIPIQNLYHAGVTELDTTTGETAEDTERLWFTMRTPLFRYRLAEACNDRDRTFREWAQKAATSLDRPRDDVSDRLAPTLIAENPLILWGGILSRGYFTDDELPLAAAAVQTCLTEQSRDRATLFINQAGTLLLALAEAGYSTGLAILGDELGLSEEPLVTQEVRTRRVHFLDAIGSAPTEWNDSPGSNPRRTRRPRKRLPGIE